MPMEKRKKLIKTLWVSTFCIVSIFSSILLLCVDCRHAVRFSKDEILTQTTNIDTDVYIMEHYGVDRLGLNELNFTHFLPSDSIGSVFPGYRDWKAIVPYLIPIILISLVIEIFVIMDKPKGYDLIYLMCMITILYLIFAVFDFYYLMFFDWLGRIPFAS